jgi:CRP-like cAMP-binding protein
MPADPTRNAFVHALPEAERGRLIMMSTPVTLELGAALLEPGERIDLCYFPLTSVISLVTVMEDGESIEAGLVGREGMAGFDALLGEAMTPWRHVVQMAGDALCIPVDRLLADHKVLAALRPLATRYQTALYWLATLTIACNRFHRVDQRAARWLLMLNDRDDDDLVEATHEFLSQMLGVRRQSVTEALGRLEEQRLLRQEGHGKLRLIDRPGLEELACECYRRLAPQFVPDGGPPTRP